MVAPDSYGLRGGQQQNTVTVIGPTLMGVAQLLKVTLYFIILFVQ
jgi:hypothetical protein